MTNPYTFTHNSMESGVAICDTDITDENLEHLKYAVDNIVTLPSQTGHDGGILTTDGADAQWAETNQIYPVIETYVNGTSWYRVYSDGWCEQGGYVISTGSITTVSLLKPYKDTNYWVSSYMNDNSRGGALTCYGYAMPNTTTDFLMGSYDANFSHRWHACGYIR